MPATIPSNLRVELLRARVRPGMSEECSGWMRMLDDRADECVATLDRERMAIEIVFRLQENDTDWLFWICVKGAAGAGLDLSLPIDRDHDAMSRRVKEPGWVRAEPQVLLLPDPIRQAVMAWALRSADEPPDGR